MEDWRDDEKNHVLIVDGARMLLELVEQKQWGPAELMVRFLDRVLHVPTLNAALLPILDGLKEANFMLQKGEKHGQERSS